MTTYRFPDGFRWGAGTSAYQIEGSPLADGAGMSIQHTFAHTPGNVGDGVTGDVLADHYNRWPEDVALMKELGLQAYQFSIAWPRVLPAGVGAVNPRGLDFYDRLVDALLDAGVEPTPILHVWDLPVELQWRGGWTNRDSAAWFAEYAAVVYERLGDRVPSWLTICEPLSMMAGYMGRLLAPATHDLYAALRAAHHVLLAHGRAVEAFRAGGATGLIGTSTGFSDVLPQSDSKEDCAAADRAMEQHTALYLDPVMLGAYPETAVARYGPAWPEVRDGDLETIAAPIDFLGVTYYKGQVVTARRPDPDAAGDGSPKVFDPLADRADYDEQLGLREVATGRPVTGIGWDVNPAGLTRALLWLRARYGDIPLVLTETGAVYDDRIVDGRVADPERQAFLRDHMIAAHAAIELGVDLRGFYVWSLIDTWEFWLGVSGRFGLVHVDWDTRQRTVKDSGRWYRDVMAHNGFDA